MARVSYGDISFQTYGDLPVVGSFAPDINLVNTKLQNVSLSNWMGKRKIMNIFVSIEREICAKSVIEFDRLGEGQEDLVMLMVSYDLPFTHARFAEEHKLRNVIGLSAIRLVSVRNSISARNAISFSGSGSSTSRSSSVSSIGT